MGELSWERRSLVAGLATLALSHSLFPRSVSAQGTTSAGYVLAPNGGEHVVHFRNPGLMFIMAGAATGSPNLALGTQQVPVGAGIPIHRHRQLDEAFYVFEGAGTIILNDVRHPLAKSRSMLQRGPERVRKGILRRSDIARARSKECNQPAIRIACCLLDRAALVHCRHQCGKTHTTGRGRDASSPLGRCLQISHVLHTHDR